MHEINLVCPINRLSYGYVSVNILKALIQNKIKVNLSPIGPIDCEDYHKEFVDIALNKTSETSPTLIVWHQWDLERFKGKDKNCGFSFFELDKLTQQDVKSINSMDEMFVSCQWYKRILGRYTLKPIHVAPLGIDTDTFKISEKRKYDGVTKYLSLGKWEIRKNMHLIPECFLRAFPTKTNYKLIVCCHNPFLSKLENEAWERLYKSRLGEHVEFVDRLVSQTEISKLMDECDAGVFISSAEGWDCPLFEMMSKGKICVVSDYSGHTEFCKPQNSLLVDITEEEEAFDGQFFFGNGSWGRFGESQINQTAKYLKEIEISTRKGMDILKQDDIIKVRRPWSDTVKQILQTVFKKEN